MKLSLRLTLAFTLVGLVVVCSIAASSWLVSSREIRTSIDDALLERSQLVVSLSESGLGTGFRVEPDVRPVQTTATEDNGAVGVLDDRTVFGEAPLVLPARVIDQVVLGESAFETIRVDDRTFRLLTTPLPGLPPNEGGAAVIGVVFYDDITVEEEAIAALAIRLSLLGAAAVAVVGLASWFAGRWLAGPLASLTTAVEHLTDQDAPVQRIEVDRSDEIGRLADQFNRMLSALEVGQEQQQRLVADASHELRTPLTALRMRAEFLAAVDELNNEQRSVAEGAVADVEQLSALVADLVDLASQARSPEEKPEEVTLSSLAEVIVERMSLATGRDITLDADESRAVVYPSMIRRAVQNLIDNAVKYSPDPEPVRVIIRAGRIEVIDRGAGIPGEDLEFVFDRFFRSPKARNRPGNGIGLAIVKQVAEAHGGQPFARNGAERGAQIGFSVPGVASSS